MLLNFDRPTRQPMYLQFRCFTPITPVAINCFALTWENEEYHYFSVPLVGAPNANGQIGINVNIGTGRLIACSMRLQNFGLDPGLFHGAIFLRQDEAGREIATTVLARGNIGWFDGVSYFGDSGCYENFEVPGLSLALPADPGANSLTYTIPFKGKWKLKTVQFSFSTDAYVVDRYAVVKIFDPSANIVWQGINATAITAGTVVAISAAIQGCSNGVSPTIRGICLPDLALNYNWDIVLTGLGAHAGDTVTGAALTFDWQGVS